MRRDRSLDSARDRPAQMFDAVLGDLAEEYALRHQGASRVRASRWYWGQLMRSALPMLWLDVRGQGWVSTLATALGAWFIASTLESFADIAMNAVLGPDTLFGTLPHFLIGLGSIALGGYVAALVRPAAPRILAVIVFIVVIVLMLTSTERLPLWFQLGFLVMGPAVAIAGGTCRRTLSRS